jgi:hypothetical protein
MNQPEDLTRVYLDAIDDVFTLSERMEDPIQRSGDLTRAITQLLSRPQTEDDDDAEMLLTLAATLKEAIERAGRLHGQIVEVCEEAYLIGSTWGSNT